jgi:DNA-binding response OmpR family regulator
LADIILVEDNASIARAYAKGLEIGGHRVRIAASEQSLRQLLEAQVPDLVILDIGNYSDRNLVHRALRLDAIDYLEKTAVTPSLLVDQVERWLARQPG